MPCGGSSAPGLNHHRRCNNRRKQSGGVPNASHRRVTHTACMAAVTEGYPRRAELHEHLDDAVAARRARTQAVSRNVGEAAPCLTRPPKRDAPRERFNLAGQSRRKIWRHHRSRRSDGSGKHHQGGSRELHHAGARHAGAGAYESVSFENIIGHVVARDVNPPRTHGSAG